LVSWHRHCTHSFVRKFLDECLPGCPGIDVRNKSPAATPVGCRVVDELSLLFDISYTLESSLELREVIRPVLLKMADGLGMKRGTITILNREAGTASISEAVGLPGGQSQQDYLVACHELIQQVMASGQAIVVPDISKEPALKARWQQEQQVDPRALSAAYICVPIKFGAEVIGALSVERILDGRARLPSTGGCCRSSPTSSRTRCIFTGWRRKNWSCSSARMSGCNTRSRRASARRT